MPASVSLSKRLQPVLSGRLTIDELDHHTRQALTIYCHFRAMEIVENQTVEQIKAELERLPEGVRELMTADCRKAYKRLRLEQNIISNARG